MHIILLSLRISKDYFLTRFLSLQTVISNVSESKLFVLQVHLEKKKNHQQFISKGGNLQGGRVCTFSSPLILCVSAGRGKERALLLINVVLDLIISTTRN